MNPLNQIGKNIKLYREKLGITQSELAAKIFVSFQAVSAWERGQSVPDLENALRLSKIFSVPLDALLREEGREFYVGIDGGGTKTEFCAFLADGTVIKRLLTEGSNPNDKGIDASVTNLTEGLKSLLEGQSPKRIFAGIAGATVGDHRKILSERLQASFGVECRVDSDAANVLSLSPDPDHAAMVICGTGSCVFVRRGEICHRLGGWGQLFDESGSAYDVGKDAIRHALAVEDGLEEKSLLSEFVKAELGGEVFRELSRIYTKGRPYIASLSSLVLKGNEAGDAVSRAILQKNADRLGLLLKKAREKYGAEEFTASGGFFKNEEFRALVEKAGACRLYAPTLPPVFGACVEVFRRRGEALPEGFRENFEQTYGRL